MAVAWRGKEARSSLSTREMIGERWTEWNLELEFAVVACPYLPFFFPLHPNQVLYYEIVQKQREICLHEENLPIWRFPLFFLRPYVRYASLTSRGRPIEGERGRQ